jgi:hypothetical protein
VLAQIDFLKVLRVEKYGVDVAARACRSGPSGAASRGELNPPGSGPFVPNAPCECSDCGAVDHVTAGRILQFTPF